MNYSSMLSFLQNLLTTQQVNNQNNSQQLYKAKYDPQIAWGGKTGSGSGSALDPNTLVNYSRWLSSGIGW